MNESKIGRTWADLFYEFRILVLMLTIAFLGILFYAIYKGYGLKSEKFEISRSQASQSDTAKLIEYNKDSLKIKITEKPIGKLNKNNVTNSNKKILSNSSKLSGKELENKSSQDQKNINTQTYVEEISGGNNTFISNEYIGEKPIILNETDKKTLVNLIDNEIDKMNWIKESSQIKICIMNWSKNDGKLFSLIRNYLLSLNYKVENSICTAYSIEPFDGVRIYAEDNYVMIEIGNI